MDEILFMGVNIPKEVEKFLNEIELNITDTMNDNELRAYKLGVKNALSILTSILVGFDDHIVIHTDKEKYNCELDIRDLKDFVYNN